MTKKEMYKNQNKYRRLEKKVDLVNELREIEEDINKLRDFIKSMVGSGDTIEISFDRIKRKKSKEKILDGDGSLITNNNSGSMFTISFGSSSYSSNKDEDDEDDFVDWKMSEEETYLFIDMAIKAKMKRANEIYDQL